MKSFRTRKILPSVAVYSVKWRKSSSRPKVFCPNIFRISVYHFPSLWLYTHFFIFIFPIGFCIFNLCSHFLLLQSHMFFAFLSVPRHCTVVPLFQSYPFSTQLRSITTASGFIEFWPRFEDTLGPHQRPPELLSVAFRRQSSI
jgi:hypothetical protein